MLCASAVTVRCALLMVRVPFCAEAKRRRSCRSRRGVPLLLADRHQLTPVVPVAVLEPVAASVRMAGGIAV